MLIIGKFIFFTVSLIAAGATSYLFALIRASGLRERRMRGFGALCLLVPHWIIASAAVALVEPGLYSSLYVIKESFLNIIPYVSCYFILNFVESKLAESKPVRIYLFAMPAISLLLLYTNRLHMIYLLAYTNPPTVGVVFYVSLTISLITLLVVYVMLFRYIVHNFKNNPLLLISGLGAIIPILLYVAYLFLPFVGFDITSIGYFLTLILFSYVAYAQRLQKTKPGSLGDTLADIAKSECISSGTVEQAARLIAREACLALDTYRIGVWRLGEDSRYLVNLVYYENETGTFTVHDDIDLQKIPKYKTLIETERMILINDAKNSEALSGLDDEYYSTLCSIADSPIRVGDRLEGVICVEQNYCNDYPTKREWRVGEQAFISSLSDIMAIAITNHERQLLLERLESELSDKTLFSKIAIDNAPIGVTVFGDNFNILDCNDAILKIFDTNKEYYRDHFMEFSPEYQPDGRRTIDMLKKVRKESVESGAVKCDWMHLNSKGEQVPTEVTIASIKQRDGYIGLAFVYDLRDIHKVLKNLSETSEQLEDALIKANEANKAKTDFLAKMSHEIRTPMNAILGMTELALRESKPAGKDEHIITVKQAGTNLLAIINDILDFSKIEAGKMDVITSEYSLASLLNDVVSIIRMRVVDSQIRFSVMADSRLPHTLIGDETKVRQALLNILSNAVKFTEYGFVTLGIYGEYINENTINLIFEVTDSGIGIKPEDINLLFNDFTQLGNNKNKEAEGIGLGLAITQSVVHAMRGSIDVRSEFGKGSTFTVKIPQRFHTSEKLAEVREKQGKSVLVFERRSVYSDSIVYTVENLGVKCTPVTKGSDLYEQMEKNNYGFLFISCALYNKNKETIERFGKDIKIVILTEFGEASGDDTLEALSMPVYCTDIADLLNDEYTDLYHSINYENITGFSAPDARILIVDDIGTNLKVAEGLIAPYGMSVDVCNCGIAAIKAVKQAADEQMYDIVFMDHKMPGMDGVEAALKIRALGDDSSCFAKLPIIALTANAVTGTMEMFLENGFNDFISKPIDIVKLNSILERWIPEDKKKPRKL